MNEPEMCGCSARIAATDAGACFGAGSHGAARTHRYALWRIWDRARPLVVFIMLNPSTADDATDDRTINRVTNFARTLGYGGVVVANAFALRSPYPGALLADPHGAVGEENGTHLAALLALTDEHVVLAWGTELGRRALRFRTAELRAIVGESARCLKLSKDGHPIHPLYIPGDTPLRIFPWPT